MTPTTQGFLPHRLPHIASSIEDLLSLHDEAFVRCAYMTVLGRDPDPDGLSHFLARIRSGESRRAILADIRLSPEGQQQENVLPGLDQAIRIYRWRRWPLLGRIFCFIGAGEERVNVRRQLAAIKVQLDVLARVVSSAGTAGQAAVLRVRPYEQQLRRTTLSRLTWQIKRVSDEAGALSLTRIEMVRALAELGLEVAPSLPGTGAAADVTALFALPPLPGGSGESSTLLVGHDWEESGYPTEWVSGLNDSLSGVASASSHAAKVLIDHGVDVPVAAIGLGVDHWERVFASPDYRAPGKAFRFLHVSSCGPDKGIDALLESFERVFSRDDDVSLIFKPSGAPPRELLTVLDRYRSSNPGFPDVVLIEDELTDADLKALYGQCHVFVAPSRAEGFGLPIAQALLSGLPVVTTAWGGHRDYCDERNSWLVDYRFQLARTPNDLIASVWAEPWARSLDDALRTAYRSTPAERSAKSSSGRKRLMERFTWKDAALRLVSLAERAKAEIVVEPGKSRVGWVTTWNVKCGIATHVEHLVASLPADEFVVFAARQEPQIRPDEPNCVRAWNHGKEENGLDEITRELTARSVSALVIQFNYGFFNHSELNDFIESVVAKGIVVIVDLHSTVDPFGERKNFRLTDFLGALRKCHRILAHSPVDMDRLKALGLVENVMLFPHGVMNKGHEPTLPAKIGASPMIASFGFCLPNKGLPELVEAVGLLKREGTPVRLLMLNAQHPAQESAAEVQKIKGAIEKLGLRDEVELRTEYLEDEVCLALLGKADLVVMVAGLSAHIEGEEMKVNADGFAGGDRTSLDLPAPQEQLLQRVQAAGKPTVLVLMNGSALSVNWADEKVPAILEAWYPGGEGGTAVAEALAGDFSPAGRLPITFYKSVDQLPPFEDYSMAKRTYRYFASKPLYPFGYGLSYTSFTYSGAKVDKASVAADGSVTISVDVANAGAMAGDEVVQLYLTHAGVTGAPLRALQVFQRVHLNRGEKKTVSFTLRDRALSVVDDAGKRRILPGNVDVWVGGGQPVVRSGLSKTTGAETKFAITSDATLPD